VEDSRGVGFIGEVGIIGGGGGDGRNCALQSIFLAFLNSSFRNTSSSSRSKLVVAMDHGMTVTTTLFSWIFSTVMSNTPGTSQIPSSTFSLHLAQHILTFK
jgi:hypothetical protein